MNRNDLPEMPQLAEIFTALRRGRHLEPRDGELYRVLVSNHDLYTELFSRLGFKLVHHPREFYYFEDSANFTDLSSRMAVFMFILVESISDKGEPVEETIMTRHFHLAELPHLQSERYQAYMREAGIVSEEDLAVVIRTMERFGFTRRAAADKFFFAPPAYRFLDLCMEFASQSENRATTKTEGEAQL